MAKLPTDIKALARVHTETALWVLAKIMSADDAPPAARVAAANALMDRGWGKAAQAIEVTGELIASKVIRAPATEQSPSSWAKNHIPAHLRQTEH